MENSITNSLEKEWDNKSDKKTGSLKRKEKRNRTGLTNIKPINQQI